LLVRFSKVALVDKYDIYQHLMTYWAEAMQDDVYVLVQGGWAAARQIRELVRNSEGKFTEDPDLALGKRKLKAELVSPALVVARFFAEEQATLEKLESAAEEAARAIGELDEEHGGEEGLLARSRPGARAIGMRCGNSGHAPRRRARRQTGTRKGADAGR
jgi:type I restriction enzyme M protein